MVTNKRPGGQLEDGLYSDRFIEERVFGEVEVASSEIGEEGWPFPDDLLNYRDWESVEAWRYQVRPERFDMVHRP